MTEEAVRSQLSETLKRAKALVGQLVKDRTSRESVANAICSPHPRARHGSARHRLPSSF